MSFMEARGVVHTPDTNTSRMRLLKAANDQIGKGYASRGKLSLLPSRDIDHCGMVNVRMEVARFALPT